MSTNIQISKADGGSLPCKETIQTRGALKQVKKGTCTSIGSIFHPFGEKQFYKQHGKNPTPKTPSSTVLNIIDQTGRMADLGNCIRVGNPGFARTVRDFVMLQNPSIMIIYEIKVRMIMNKFCLMPGLLPILLAFKVDYTMHHRAGNLCPGEVMFLKFHLANFCHICYPLSYMEEFKFGRI